MTYMIRGDTKIEKVEKFDEVRAVISEMSLSGCQPGMVQVTLRCRVREDNMGDELRS